MSRYIYNQAVRILMSLYAIECAVLLVLAGIYKAPARDLTVLHTKAGIALIAGAICLIASAWLLLVQMHSSDHPRRKAFAYYRPTYRMHTDCRKVRLPESPLVLSAPIILAAHVASPRIVSQLPQLKCYGDIPRFRLLLF